MGRLSALRIRELGFIAIALLLVLVAQHSCIQTEFLDDDYLHLYEIATFRFPGFIFTTWAGHSLVTFRVALTLMHWAFGGNALAFSLAGLLLHFINVVLLHAILRRYATAPLAAAAAGVWGMSPIHFGTIGWTSALFGQGLVTTCLFLAILLLFRYFGRRQAPPPWAIGACIALLVVGAMAYSIGTALAVVFPAVAWLLSPPASNPRRLVLALSPLLAVPFVHFALLQGEGIPHVSGEIVFVWLVGVARLLCRLVAYGIGVLVAGPLFAVRGNGLAGWPLWDVAAEDVLLPTYSVAASLLVWLAWSYRRGGATARRAIVAALVLAIGPYGLIAFGRADLSGSFIVSRYHYASVAALAMAFGVAGSVCVRKVPAPFRAALAGLGGLYLCALAAGSFRIGPSLENPIERYGRTSAAEARVRLERAIDGAPVGATLTLENEPFGGVRLLMAMGGKPEEFPRLAGFFAILYAENTVRGRRVRFVEHDLRLARYLWEGTNERLRDLVVYSVPEDRRRALLGDPAALQALRGAIERAPDAVEAVRSAEREQPGLGSSRDLAQGALTMHMGPRVASVLRRAVAHEPAGLGLF